MPDKTVATLDHDRLAKRVFANDAMQQLSWAIGYLHGIGKHAQARTLAINRRIIREHLLEHSGQPLPAQAEGVHNGRREHAQRS